MSRAGQAGEGMNGELAETELASRWSRAWWCQGTWPIVGQQRPDLLVPLQAPVAPVLFQSPLLCPNDPLHSPAPPLCLSCRWSSAKEDFSALSPSLANPAATPQPLPSLPTPSFGSFLKHPEITSLATHIPSNGNHCIENKIQILL